MPAAMADQTDVAITGLQRLGDGLPCSACGEPVVESEPLYTTVARGLTYGFHEHCYRARLEVPRD